MIIDISKLKGYENSIEINEVLNCDEETLKNTNILELKNIKVEGSISKIGENDYNLNVRVYGTMVLPCRISLKPTDYNFDFNIDGNIIEMLDEIEKSSKNIENTIDIFPIIWENILTEVPIGGVVNSDIDDIKLEGDGWRFGKEEDSINPELAKLKDLLK